MDNVSRIVKQSMECVLFCTKDNSWTEQEFNQVLSVMTENEREERSGNIAENNDLWTRQALLRGLNVHLQNKRIEGKDTSSELALIAETAFKTKHPNRPDIFWPFSTRMYVYRIMFKDGFVWDKPIDLENVIDLTQ
jgi:hypothetical protein